MYALSVVKILCLIHVVFVSQSSSQPTNKGSQTQFCFFASSELIYENVMQQVASSAKCEGGGKLLDNKVSLGGVQGSVDDFDSVWGAVYSVDEIDYPAILRYAQSRSQLNFMSQTRVTVQGTRTPSICRTVDVGIISSAFPFTSQSEATFQTSVAQYIERLRQLGASERYVRKFNTAQKWMPASFGSNPSQRPMQTPARRRTTCKTMNQKTSKASSSNPLSHRDPADVSEQDEPQSTTPNKLNPNAKKIVKVEKIKQSNDDSEQTTIVTQKVGSGEVPQHQITTVTASDDGSVMTTSVSNNPALIKDIPNIMEGGLQHPMVSKYPNFENQPTRVEPGLNSLRTPLTSPQPLPLTDPKNEVIDRYGHPKPLLPQNIAEKPYYQYPPSAKVDDPLNQPMWQPNLTPPEFKHQENPMLPKNDGLMQPTNRVPQFSRPENSPVPSSQTTLENTPKEISERQVHSPKDLTPLTKHPDQLENVGEKPMNKLPHRPMPTQNTSESSEEDDTTVPFANSPRKDFTPEDIGKPVQKHLPQSPSPDPSFKDLERSLGKDRPNLEVVKTFSSPNNSPILDTPTQNNPLETKIQDLENLIDTDKNAQEHLAKNPLTKSSNEQFPTPSVQDLPRAHSPTTLVEKTCSEFLPRPMSSSDQPTQNQPLEQVCDPTMPRRPNPMHNNPELLEKELQNPTLVHQEGPPFKGPTQFSPQENIQAPIKKPQDNSPERLEERIRDPKSLPSQKDSPELFNPNLPAEKVYDKVKNIPQEISREFPQQLTPTQNNPELIQNKLQNPMTIEENGPKRPTNYPLRQENNSPKMLEERLHNPKDSEYLPRPELSTPNQVCDPRMPRRPNPLEKENELLNPKIIEKDGPKRSINNPLEQYDDSPRMLEENLTPSQVCDPRMPRRPNPIQDNPELLEKELENQRFVDKDYPKRPIDNLTQPQQVNTQNPIKKCSTSDLPQNHPPEILEEKLRNPNDSTSLPYRDSPELLNPNQPVQKVYDHIMNTPEQISREFPRQPIPQTEEQIVKKDGPQRPFNNPSQEGTQMPIEKFPTPPAHNVPLNDSPTVEEKGRHPRDSKFLHVQESSPQLLTPNRPTEQVYDQTITHTPNPELLERELRNPTFADKDYPKRPIDNLTQPPQHTQNPMEKCFSQDLPQDNSPEMLEEKIRHPRNLKYSPHQKDSPQLTNTNQPVEEVYDQIVKTPEKITREFTSQSKPIQNDSQLLGKELENPRIIENDGPKRPVNNPLQENNPELIENEVHNPQTFEKDGPRRPVNNPLQENNPELIENELHNPKMLEKDGPRRPIDNPLRENNPELIENEVHNPQTFEKDGPRRPVNNPFQENNPELIENEVHNPQIFEKDGPRRPIDDPLRENNPELIENKVHNPKMLEKDGPRRPIDNPLQENNPELIENELQNQKMFEKDGVRHPVNDPLQPNNPELIENELQNPKMIRKDGPRRPVNNPLQENNPELMENELQNPKMLEKVGPRRPIDDPLQENNPELIEKKVRNFKMLEKYGPRRPVKNPLQENNPELIENKVHNPKMLEKDGPRRPIDDPLQENNPELIENELQNQKMFEKDGVRHPVNDPLQPNNPELIEHELQNPKMIEKGGPRRPVNNPLQENNPELMENELQNPKMLEKVGPRRPIDDPLQENNPELIENKVRNFKMLEKYGPRRPVNDPLRENNPELIENKVHNPKMLEKDGTRRPVNDPLQENNPELIENEVHNPQTFEKDGPRRPVNNPLQENNPELIENKVHNPQTFEKDGVRHPVNNPLQPNNPELIENELQNPKMIEKGGPRRPNNNPLQENKPELMENEVHNPKMLEKDGTRRPVNDPLQENNPELIENELQNQKMFEKDGVRRPVNDPLQQNNPELMENELQNPKMIEKGGPRRPVNNPLQENNPELMENELQNPKMIEKDGPRRPIDDPELIEDKLQNPKMIEKDGPRRPIDNSFRQQKNPELVDNEPQRPTMIEKDGPRRPVQETTPRQPLEQVCDPKLPRRPNPIQDNPELLEKELENPKFVDKDYPKRPIDNLTQPGQQENTQIPIKKYSSPDSSEDELSETLEEELHNPKDLKSLPYQKDSPELLIPNRPVEEVYDQMKNTPKKITRDILRQPIQNNPQTAIIEEKDGPKRLVDNQSQFSEQEQPTQLNDIPELSQEKVENAMSTDKFSPTQSNNVRRPSPPTSLHDILEKGSQKGIYGQGGDEPLPRQNLFPKYTNENPTKLEDTPYTENIDDQLMNGHQPEDFKEYSSEPGKQNPTKREDTLMLNQQVHEQSSNTFKRTSRDFSRRSTVQQNNPESAEPTTLNERPITQTGEAYDQPSQEMLHRSPRPLNDPKTLEERKVNPTLMNKDGPIKPEFSNLNDPNELPTSQTPEMPPTSPSQNKPLRKGNQPKDGPPSLQNTPIEAFEDQHPRNPNHLPLQEDLPNLHNSPQRMVLNKDDQPMNTPQNLAQKAPEEVTQDTLESSEEDDLEKSPTEPANIRTMQDGSQDLIQENTKKALKKIQSKSEKSKNLKNKAPQSLPQQSNQPQPLVQQLAQERKKAELNLDKTIEEILSTPKQNSVCTTVSPGGQTTTVISQDGNAPTILVNGQPVTSPGLSNGSPLESPPLPNLETVNPEVRLLPNEKNSGPYKEEMPNTNSKLNSQETSFSRRTKQTQNQQSTKTETEIIKSNPRQRLDGTDTPDLQSSPTRELLRDEGNNYLDLKQDKPNLRRATENQKQISNVETPTRPQSDSNDPSNHLPDDKTSIPGFTFAQLVPEYNVLTRANRPSFMKENTPSSQTSKRNTAKVGTQTSCPTKTQGTATSTSIATSNEGGTATSTSIATSNKGVAKPPTTLEKILTPNTNSNTPVVTTTPISTPNAKGMNIQVQSPNGMASTTHITSNGGDGSNKMSVVSVSSSSGQPQTTTNLVVNGNPTKNANNSAAVSSSTTA